MIRRRTKLTILLSPQCNLESTAPQNEPQPHIRTYWVEMEKKKTINDTFHSTNPMHFIVLSFHLFTETKNK